ncbi:MAG TPA: chemotaxis protein CheA, partial [Desulfobacterales bacterium]|nr:chemotaxis protein CheA [Desulfobacterales bacterium]
ATLDDSAENYAHVGEAIGVMQEAARQEDDADDRQVAAFCEVLRKTGFAVPDAEVAAGTVPLPKSVGADEATDAQQEESAVAGEGEGASSASEPSSSAPPEGETDAGQSPGAAAASPASGNAEEEEEPIVQDPQEFMQDMDLLSGFVEEAMEHLETIEVNVLELENSPGDPEIINNIFRPFHTIKGVSGFLNLKAINKLAHATENLLDDVRNGVRAMDSDVIDVVLSVGDYLKAMIDNLRDVIAQGPEAYKNFDIREYTRRIKAIREGKPSESSPAAPAPADTAAPAPPAAPAAAAAPASSAAPAPGKPAAPAPPASARASVSGKKVDASIKVNIEKLDALVNAVGELVIMQSLVQENPHIQAIVDPKLTRDFSQLARITSELQKTAMSMRMVPIRQTFQKMIRLVRDLSKKSGKIVNLVMEGEDTEIDRNMVDSIYDPLVHMIRNSVDHGVQPPEERQKLGKPPAGTVALRAYQKGGNMVIEIEDDGNGLNTEKIRQKAIERG